MGAIALASAQAFARSYVGKRVEVLLEQKEKGYWLGHTQHYLQVMRAGPG